MKRLKVKWFKNYCDNHRGRTVQKILDVHGHSGVVIYYFLLELCAEKFDIEYGKTAQDDDCAFAFNRRVIASVTRTKWSTIASVLATGAECSVWQWEANDNEIEIKMPMLLDLLSSDAKRPREKRGKTAGKPRLDKIRLDKIRLEVEEKEISETPTENLFSIPDAFLVNLKMLEGYPDKVITEVAKEAWLIYNATAKKGSDWPRFLSHYFKNEKQKIRDRIINDPDAAIERMRKKYEGSEYEF